MMNAVLYGAPLVVMPVLIWWRPDGMEGPNRLQAVRAGNAQWFTNPTEYTRK